MSSDNIVQIRLDTFDPKTGPKIVEINLDTATMEELKPYIYLDDRIKDAYSKKVIEDMGL